MENEKNLIKELKEKRLAYGVSQNKLAVASHITRPYLSDIETGKAVPTQQGERRFTERFGTLQSR